MAIRLRTTLKNNQRLTLVGPLNDLRIKTVMDICTVDGCQKAAFARRMCKSHVNGVKELVPARDSRSAYMDHPTYMGLHNRLRSARGAARNYLCSAPGCDKQALDWALIDPDYIVNAKGRRYSTDIWNGYRPECRSCHMTRDLGDRRVTA